MKKLILGMLGLAVLSFNLVIHLQSSEEKLIDAKGKHFQTSANCTWCHTEHIDFKQRQDVSIDHDWAGSMMAHSAVDPLWQAKMASEVIRHPKLGKVIEKKCSRCHTPMAYKESEFENQPVALQKGGFLNPRHKYHKLAMDGVSCTVCHQIKPMKDVTRHFSGHYPITPTNDRDYSPLYGPFKEPFQGPMRNHTGYQPVYSKHVQKAELCATCHTLYTPVIAEGKVIGKFPEQTPYLEMKHSKFKNRSCQSCHMVFVNQKFSLSTRPPWYKTKRGPLGRHTFQGANVFMLKLLLQNHQLLKLKSSKKSLRRKIEMTKQFLQKKSARISLVKREVRGDKLHLTLKVENLSGHKLPTGFPSRRVWVHLKVTKGKQVVFESGKPLARGRIQGDDLDDKKYEPHYDTITHPDQVQIYESLFSNHRGQLSFSLLEAKQYLKDNRLLPPGFDKQKAPHDIKVAGKAFADNNFIGGSDVVKYEIPLKQVGQGKIYFALCYQTLGDHFARDMFQFSPRSERIARFEKMYARADHTPTVLAQGQATWKKK